MRWLWVWVVVLSGMATIGCPSEFGKGGRIDKAVQKDSTEYMMMLTSCSEEWKNEVCDKGSPDWDIGECQKCGGP